MSHKDRVAFGDAASDALPEVVRISDAPNEISELARRGETRISWATGVRLEALGGYRRDVEVIAPQEVGVAATENYGDELLEAGERDFLTEASVTHADRAVEATA